MLKRVFLILVLLLLVWLLWEWATFPNTAKLASENPTTTAFMEQRKQELRAAGKSDALLYTFVRYDRISPYLRRGVLVAEDNDFYQHGGVDVKAMKEAVERDWKRRKITHGGSTITQQLAKNLYLSPSRNPLRKIKEYFLARSLERHLSKKRILELYMNVVEMGERVYGAEAGSRFYFQRSAASLSSQQAALLAGCLPNPRLMSPGAPNKRLRARQRMILSRMRRWGYLLEEETLTEKKPEAPAAPATDTALQQTPPTDTATPAVTPSESEGPGGAAGTTTEPTATTDTSKTSAEPPPP
ncbi:MAG TPA: monofunctional biosynthetic peptidoglycan transglycosylase [Thermoanaerobaculia bacterium]|nr:monofunctional biosynthetic peptidoglycan transglycosylase [Thermoanaerobaculia bacterium]